MLNSLLIFVGAGFGGIFRYWVSNAIYLLLGKNFPYGTFIVNVTGCFLMGLFSIFIMERFANHGPQLRALLLIGLLGGYTTFSSFSIETINLVENGNWINGVINILLSTITCITATWLGLIGGRNL